MFTSELFNSTSFLQTSPSTTCEFPKMFYPLLSRPHGTPFPHLVLLCPEKDPPITTTSGDNPVTTFVCTAMHKAHMPLLASLQGLQQCMMA